MRKIRIAQIGMNRYSHANDIFITLKRLPEIFDIAGYAIVEDERETCAYKLDIFDGYRELTVEEILNDPTIEAVFVETDEIHLTKYAQMVAESGKHIHMEKPGGTSLADFERLIETVKAGGKIFHTGYMYRYNPFISDVIKRANNGEFGDIFSVEAHMSRYDNAETREWLSTFKGGMMFYLGCHLVDLVFQIQGAPTNVIPLNRSSGLNGVNAEDIGCAVLEYPNGISFIRMSGTEVGGGSRRQLVVCGSKATVEIKPLETRPKIKSDRLTPFDMSADKIERFLDDEGNTKKIAEKSDQFDRYEEMLLSFAAMVRGEKENPYTYDYELELYKLVLRCCGAI